MTNTQKALLIIPLPLLLLVCGGIFVWDYHKKTTHEYWGLEEARENTDYVRKLRLDVEPSGPGSLMEFKNLEHLNLAVYWTQYPGREYEQWKNVRLPSRLKKLRLHFADKRVIPVLLKQVPGLEYFYLSCETRGEDSRAPLPVFSLEKNRKLRKLYIHGCSYDRMPIGLTGLSRLETIHVSSVTIKKLPHDFSRLKNLKELNMRFYPLNELPPDFHMLAGLEELELNNGTLEEPVVKLKDLPNLKILRLNDVYRKGAAIVLEPGPGDFPALEELHIHYYKLSSLKGLEHLRKLRVLKLGSLSLNPAKTVWSFPAGLRELELEELGLRKLPLVIGTLKELRFLSLFRNCLTELPAGFRNLKKLKQLNLNRNGFQRFPKLKQDMPELVEYRIDSDIDYYKKNCYK